MKAFKQISRDTRQESILSKYGFSDLQRGVDGHVTYSKSKTDKILVDVPGNEWHFMKNGVVQEVGKMSDDSLEKFLKIGA